MAQIHKEVFYLTQNCLHVLSSKVILVFLTDCFARKQPWIHEQGQELVANARQHGNCSP